MRRAAGLVVVLALTTAACTASGETGDREAEPSGPVGIRPDLPSVVLAATIPASIDTLPASGNRLYDGTGVLDRAEPIDVELGAVPTWVVGLNAPTGPEWIVAVEDGQLLRVSSATADRTGAAIDARSPPVVIIDVTGTTMVLGAPEADASPTGAARVLGGALWWIGLDGTLVEESATGGRFVYDIDALWDSRIAVSADGRLAVLSEPTDRYPHGIAGDPLEASAVTIIDPSDRSERSFLVDETAVVEGVGVMWIDADGDGIEELLATLSDAVSGSRLVLFDADGTRRAEGPPIGQGNRWRHQIGAGPVGPESEFEIVSVRTPHIRGIAQLYRLVGDELKIVAEASGVTSHHIFSRNMDMALLADADGDGTIELVAPTQDLERLAGLRRDRNGAQIVWTVALGGRLQTNVAAVSTPEGGLALAAGTDDGRLRIWQP